MRVPDYLALGAAGIALALSIFLWFGGSRDEGLFVAVWVPSILTFATYIKVSLPGGRWAMAPIVLFAIGAFTVVLLAIFVYASVRGVTHPPAEPPQFDELLRAEPGEATHPLRILLAIDGSPCSVAAVNDVAHCRLPNGSAVEILNVIHSGVPVMFDPAFALAAAHAEEQHEQERRSPEILEAAATRLRRHRPHLDVITKVVEGIPKDVILREATEWHADRVVVGSHGYGRAGRAVFGSTAAAVAAGAPCSVVIARPAPSADDPALPWSERAGESSTGILRPWAQALGAPGPGYFFFICSPQQISECGIPGGHGQPFSYTNSAPHFSQT
jgi:nucleotide-binding universal stress UspA family protein